MTIYADMEKIGSNPILSIPSISDSTKIEGLIYLLEITIKVGKHFPIIILSLAGLNLLLAANDFLSNSINFAILNSMFAIGGFISLVQLNQSRKDHSFEYNSNNNKIDKTHSVEIRK
ncbi:MAG TPA: hypothetical protein VMW74_02180 [Nitrosopumilaceae archaeon]|nr:hypothetical protein [Nitrosopumilaceae archaeon]